MASANFPRCLVQILKHEGGFTKNPKDPGNWTGGKVGKGKLVGTLKGIAASAHPDRDIPNLTDSEIASIYRAQYFAPAGCEAMPVGVDLAVFDAAVNSGVSRGRKWHAGAKDRGSDKLVIQGICAARMAFLRGLGTFKTFGKGWTPRVANVEATAVAWALAQTSTPGTVKTELKIEAAKATAMKKSATKAATATTGGALASPAVPTDAVLSPDLWPYAVGVVAAILIVTAVALAYRARVAGARADAYSEAAAHV